MEFLLLGDLEVRDENGPVALAAPKQRALLAALLLRSNQVVPTDRLLIDLWGEDAPPAARNNLQVLVHRLRRSLGDNRLVRRGDGYLLVVESGELDVDRFERARAEAANTLARGEHALAAESFRSALSFWRGPPLADLRDEPFARLEAERLEELELATVEDRIDAELALGSTATWFQSCASSSPSTRSASGCTVSSCSPFTGQAASLMRSLNTDALGTSFVRSSGSIPVPSSASSSRPSSGKTPPSTRR